MAREQEFIKIRGAKEHNLKNIDLDIPRNEMIVFTGLSGSGKSSLAFKHFVLLWCKNWCDWSKWFRKIITCI